MKKILLSTIVVGLLGVNSMADDKITVTGDILPSAVVGFVDVTGETLNANNRFIDATIDLGTAELNSNFATAVNFVYIKSNNPNGVQISITPHEGEDASGALTGANGETLPITYYLGEFTQYNMNNSPTFTLTAEATDGTTQGLTFAVIPNIPHSDQTAGIYDTVLDVTITTP